MGTLVPPMHWRRRRSEHHDNPVGCYKDNLRPLPMFRGEFHWKSRAVMMPNSSPLVVPQVVITINDYLRTTIDDRVDIMTTVFFSVSERLIHRQLYDQLTQQKFGTVFGTIAFSFMTISISIAMFSFMTISISIAMFSFMIISISTAMLRSRGHQEGRQKETRQQHLATPRRHRRKSEKIRNCS